MSHVLAALMPEFLSTPSARRATRGSISAGFLVGFLSTPSARRATMRTGLRVSDVLISIHALREEGDAGSWLRSPCAT